MPAIRRRKISKSIGGSLQAAAKNDSPLSTYFDQIKKILIIRRQGGAGDILMTRMLFYDIKKLCPNHQVDYAIPPNYWPLVQDHPYIDNVLNCNSVDTTNYGFVSDITNQCGRYETSTSPFVTKHRSDIWANHIGINLTQHEGHINFSNEEIQTARALLAKVNPKDVPVVVITPITAHSGKDIPLNVIEEVAKGVRSRGYFPLLTHSSAVELKEAYCLYDASLRQWMAAVSLCNIGITAATSAYCLLNLLHKPTVAVFGCEDLDVYAMHFPECTPVQRHRADRNGWDFCPCWCCWQCVYKTPGLYPPACLESITADEILFNFDKVTGVVAKDALHSNVKKNKESTLTTVSEERAVEHVPEQITQYAHSRGEIHLSLKNLNLTQTVLLLPTIEALFSKQDTKVIVSDIPENSEDLFKFSVKFIILRNNQAKEDCIEVPAKDSVKFYKDFFNVVSVRNKPFVRVPADVQNSLNDKFFKLDKKYVFVNTLPNSVSRIAGVINKRKRVVSFCNHKLNIRTFSVPYKILARTFVLSKCNLIITSDTLDVHLVAYYNTPVLFVGSMKQELSYSNVKFVDNFEDITKAIENLDK